MLTAALVTVILVLTHPAHAMIEVSGHLHGLGPDAGGVSVRGLRTRWNWVEGSVQAFEGESLAYALTVLQPFASQGSFMGSIGLTTLRRNTIQYYGSSLGFRWTPLRLGNFALGLRLDNELLYERQTQRIRPEYFVGATLYWR